MHPNIHHKKHTPFEVQKDTKKYLTLSKEEKRSHVAAYEKSKMTQKSYCEKNGLKLSSFKNWVARERFRHDRRPAGNFVPLIATTGKTSADTPRVEIYKGDTKVVLSHALDTKWMVEIITELFSCISH